MQIFVLVKLYHIKIPDKDVKIGVIYLDLSIAVMVCAKFHIFERTCTRPLKIIQPR